MVQRGQRGVLGHGWMMGPRIREVPKEACSTRASHERQGPGHRLPVCATPARPPRRRASKLPGGSALAQIV
jgi:hypothetical protein